MAGHVDSVFTWFGERIKDQDSTALFLLVPVTLFEVAFFVVPFCILLRMSFNAQSPNGFYESAWTLASYQEVLRSDLLHDILLFSFKFAVIATVLSVIIGLFYAYAVYRADGFKRSILLFAVVLPLLTTLVVKTYAWRPLLSPDGVLNNVLLSLGVISTPISFAPGLFGAVVGQVYIVVPYSILSIYSVLSTIDWAVVEAARDLGASRPRSFVEVVLPEVLPGIAVATVVSFAWSVGAYAAPSQLGSGQQTTFAMYVEQIMLNQFNWPFGAALSVVMLGLMLVVSLAAFRLLGGSGGVGDV
ncbi:MULTISPECIES: ABC transporter permease [Halobacterium]|uniref:ABC transporter permease n=1 Tax=Halobacterium TaxID=2239 RepID=UPI00073F4105|nr:MULTISPECIES: ABC transporter permease [Halobacterium]MCG1002824.1 ABC transporter permease [Halobacterium noricense]